MTAEQPSTTPAPACQPPAWSIHQVARMSRLTTRTLRHRASYTGLGRLYVDDPGFRERYDARHPGLAEYLRDAIAAYAAAHLA